MQCLLNAAQNQGAEGIGDIEDHDADGVAAPAPQRTRKRIRPVAEFLRGLANMLFRAGRNIS